MVREEDREPTLLGSPNKHQGNGPREGVDVNSIGALLVENLSECRGGFGIATAIELLEHVLALRRRAIPPHAQAIMLIGLIYAAAGGRRDKRFDPVSPQPMRQGFDIDLRAANRVRRKRERYMYYFQDSRGPSWARNSGNQGAAQACSRWSSSAPASSSLRSLPQ